jgi:hypothetical protein
MADFVLETADKVALDAAITQMGFVDAQGHPVLQGPIPGDPNPQASYFLEVVGVRYAPTGNTITDPHGNPQPEMAPMAGWWSILRINGTNPIMPGLLQVPASVTVYPPVVFLADGTPDPNYHQPIIGSIA